MRETDTNHCCLMSDSFVTDFHSSIELNVSSLSPLLDHRLLDMALNRQNVTINSFWKYHDQNSSLFSSCYFSVWSEKKKNILVFEVWPCDLMSMGEHENDFSSSKIYNFGKVLTDQARSIFFSILNKDILWEIFIASKNVPPSILW